MDLLSAANEPHYPLPGIDRCGVRTTTPVSRVRFMTQFVFIAGKNRKKMSNGIITIFIADS